MSPDVGRALGTEGLLVVDKPSGPTSHDVVARVRRLAGTRRVGHAGTLDPMATGVLVLGLGRATRLLGHLVLADKAYEAVVRLGRSTTTDDAEGERLSESDASGVSREDVVAAAAALTGAQLQVPSSVSAVKVAGRRSYARVRAGESVQLAPRPVTVSRLDVGSLRPAGSGVLDVELSVECSSGTYVRALARDLGRALGVGGHLVALRRTRVGRYGLDQAVTLAELEQGVHPIPLAAAAAAAFRSRTVDDTTARRLSHGAAVEATGSPDAVVAVLDETGELVALVRDDGELARPLAVFAAAAASAPPPDERPTCSPPAPAGTVTPARPASSHPPDPSHVRKACRVTRWDAPEDVPDDLGPTVVSIGVFDGVHRGHRAVIARARELADRLGLPLVVLTFDPHPLAVVRPEAAPPAVTSLRHRVALLEAAGADGVLVLPFDQALAHQDAADFVTDVLVQRLRARAVVVGKDFRFGYRAAGDVALLTRLGAREGFTVEALGPVGDGTARWSSTVVRDRVAAGDVAAAADALGHPFRVEGVVVEGDKRGRALGYPTANLPVREGVLVPPDGVYAGRLTRLDEPDAPALPAAVSIGTNPTFDGLERRVEAYVLDRDDLELYGVPVAMEVLVRLRGQVRFDGVEELVEQMGRDVEDTRAALQRPGGTPGAAPRW